MTIHPESELGVSEPEDIKAVLALLETIKADNDEMVSSAFVMLDSKNLCKFVSAWEKAGVEFQPRPTHRPSLIEEGKQWEWLWQWSEFSTRKIGRLSGVTSTEAEALFYQAKGLMLIYPDGTVSKPATTCLVSIMEDKGIGEDGEPTTAKRAGPKSTYME